VGKTTVEANGSFELSVPPGEDLVVTVLGEDHRAFRMRANVSGREQVDLGDIDAPATEFPPGVSGKAWDLHADGPVTQGSVTLRRGDAVVGSDRINGDGDFSIEMTADRLLTGGTYQLVVEAPGYERAVRLIELSDELTSHRLGRVELIPKAAD
jgi:hypothetical protein